MADISYPVFGDVWASTGDRIAPPAEKISQGWTQEMMPFQYQNYLQGRVDSSIAYLLQKGVPEYNASQEYIANKSVVLYLGGLYVCTATSTGVLPTNTTNWRKLTVSVGVDGTIPVSAGGTGAATATQARTNLGLGSWAIANVPTLNGIVAKKADGSFEARTISGTTNYVTVENGDGISGNPVINVGSRVAKLDQDAAWTTRTSIRIPVGATEEAGVGVVGRIRFDTTLNEYVGYKDGAWQPIGSVGINPVYNFSGNGVNTDFTLLVAPKSENNVDVFFSGVYQNKNTYTLSGNTVVFSEAPPAGVDNIEIRVQTSVPVGNTTAGNVSLIDSGNYYQSSNVEGALYEVGGKLKSTILHFATLAEASAAAATLPDEQVVVSDADEVKGVVVGGSFTQEQSIYKVADYAKVRGYTGRGTRLRVVDPTGAHWWVQRGAAADNGGTALVDASGRSWEREFKGAVNALWFGADPSGVSASDDALVRFCLAASGGFGQVPSGTYRVDVGNYSIAANTSIFHKSATFLMAGAPAQASVYTASGVEGTLYPLTANATKSATNAFLSAPNLVESGIQEGDWVRICSNAVFDAARTNSKIGEQIRVKQVNTVTGELTFSTPLQDSYTTSDAATISKMAHVRGVALTGTWVVESNNTASKRHKAVTLSICEAPYVTGLTGRKLDDRALYFLDCVFPKAHACHFEDFLASSTGYGISVTSATQDGVFTAMTSRNVRHLFTTNNATARPGIPRRIILNGFNAQQSAFATGGSGGDSVDTHAAAEDIHLWNGVIQGSSSQGVNFECASGSLVNIHTYDTLSNGVGVHNESDRAGKIKLLNVHAHRSGASGVSVLNGGGSGVYEEVDASNISSEDSANVGVNIRGTSSKPIKSAKLSGLSATRAGGTVASVYVECVDSGYLTGASAVDGKALSQHAIRIRDAKNFTATQLTGRLPSSGSGALVYVNSSTPGDVDGLVIDGVTGDSPSAAGSRGILVDNNSTNVTIGLSCRLDKFTFPIQWGTGTGHRGGFIRGTATYDPPSLAVNAMQATTVTVTGAAIGDYAKATFSIANASIRWTAEVTATNTVTVIMQNVGGSPVDLASGTIKVVVEKI